jgi:hypothetical protein
VLYLPKVLQEVPTTRHRSYPPPNNPLVIFSKFVLTAGLASFTQSSKMRLCGRRTNSLLPFSYNRNTISKKFFSSSRSLHQQPDGLVLGVYQDGSFTSRGKQLSESLKHSINWQLDLSKVKGKLDQKALVFVPQNDQTPERIAVVGLGEKAETNKIEVARRASSIGVKTLKSKLLLIP